MGFTFKQIAMSLRRGERLPSANPEIEATAETLDVAVDQQFKMTIPVDEEPPATGPFDPAALTSRQVEPSTSQSELATQETRDLIAGTSNELRVTNIADPALREIVATELLKGISRPATDQAGPSSDEQIARARQLFIDLGLFNEAIQNLRTAESAAKRIAAARALGIIASRRGTAHLIAALFDDVPEVRTAAGEALALIGDPTVSIGPLSSMVAGRIDWAAPEVVQRIESGSATVAETGSRAPAIDHGQDVVLPPVLDPSQSPEESQLLQQEGVMKRSIEGLERRALEKAAELKEAALKAIRHLEQESLLRTEAATRRREEEEVRRRADDEAKRRRKQEEETFSAARTACLQAEAEAHKLAEEESRLRLESLNLRHTAHELARQRARIEAERHEAVETDRRTEAARSLQEALEKHNAELERLQNEEQALEMATAEVQRRRSELEADRRAAETELQRLVEDKEQLEATRTANHAEFERWRREAQERYDAEQGHLQLQLDGLRRIEEEVSVRRAEVEASRQKADEEAAQLLELQERIRTAEAERFALVSETSERLEAEQRLLEDALRHAAEEQERFEREATLRREQEEQRLAELEALRDRMEMEMRQRIKAEEVLQSQIESLRIADSEARNRVEEAEARRRTAEHNSRLIEEKVQRVQAEAHASALEEERIIARLEAVRREVAIEAQARASQEQRIKEEIELLRRLEQEQSPRIEAATRSRAAVEAQLQKEKERLIAEEEARLSAQEELGRLTKQNQQNAEADMEWRDDPSENLRPSPSTPAEPFALTSFETAAVPELSGTLVEYLQSVDPHQRAAALAELPVLGVNDAFSLIVKGFDDDSPQVRNAAARALRKLEPQGIVELFTRALEEGSPERRQNIGAALAESGMASEAINDLASENREDTYNALCLLFVMAKAGQIEPLQKAIEEICPTEFKPS